MSKRFVLDRRTVLRACWRRRRGVGLPTLEAMFASDRAHTPPAPRCATWHGSSATRAARRVDPTRRAGCTSPLTQALDSTPRSSSTSRSSRLQQQDQPEDQPPRGDEHLQRLPVPVPERPQLVRGGPTLDQVIATSSPGDHGALPAARGVAQAQYMDAARPCTTSRKSRPVRLARCRRVQPQSVLKHLRQLHARVRTPMARCASAARRREREPQAPREAPGELDKSASTRTSPPSPAQTKIAPPSR